MIVGYDCHQCKDVGWVYRSDNPKSPDFGKAFPCECREHINAERRRQYLFQIDGLTPGDRTHVFEEFQINPGNRAAYDAVTGALVKRRGMITLTGKWGLGKTELLICAVNRARESGIPAVYTTTAQLFDYLRQAYKPGEEIDIDRRWQLLTSAEVLAVDELEKFNATPWAMERFSRLIDERWRCMGNLLTLLATNARIEQLPGDVTSRLEDGRAEIVTLGGSDMRKFNEWGQP
jgi:DNA replication protein DnaC